MRHAFDMHVHSWYSYDAHLSPEEIFSEAQRRGVVTLCVCDHHNMDGFGEIQRARRNYPDVTWAPGMEVSALTRLGEFDFVAAGLPLDAPARLSGLVDVYRRWMCDFNASLLRGFSLLGVPFGEKEKEEMLRSWRPGPASKIQGEVRLPNNGLKPWLLDRGIISESGGFGGLMKEAFNSAGGKPPLPDASDVLPRFRELGGVIILAHPNRLLENEGEAAFQRLLDEAGVDGIEAGHFIHSPERAAEYTRLAKARGLLVSGGTDVHFPREVDRLGEHLCPEEDAGPLLRRLGV